MKNRIFTLCTLVATLVSGLAVATTNTGMYISGKAGPAFLSHLEFNADFEDGNVKEKSNVNVGYFLSGAIGYKFCYGFRVEGEIAYRHHQLEKMKIEDVTLRPSLYATNYMANAYYDFNLTRRWQPFLGVGIGYIDTGCKVRASGGGEHDVEVKLNSGEFAWQWMAGVNYNICDNLDLITEYRMMQNEKNNVLSFGLRRYF